MFFISINIHCSCLPGSSGADLNAKNDSQRIILVMFLGGCTFSEISALRFFGREKGEPASPFKICLLAVSWLVECCSFFSNSVVAFFLTLTMGSKKDNLTIPAGPHCSKQRWQWNWFNLNQLVWLNARWWATGVFEKSVCGPLISVACHIWVFKVQIKFESYCVWNHSFFGFT